MVPLEPIAHATGRAGVAGEGACAGTGDDARASSRFFCMRVARLLYVKLRKSVSSPSVSLLARSVRACAGVRGGRSCEPRSCGHARSVRHAEALLL